MDIKYLEATTWMFSDTSSVKDLTKGSAVWKEVDEARRSILQNVESKIAQLVAEIVNKGSGRATIEIPIDNVYSKKHPLCIPAGFLSEAVKSYILEVFGFKAKITFLNCEYKNKWFSGVRLVPNSELKQSESRILLVTIEPKI